MKQFFAYYNIKHIIGIPDNSIGLAVIERSNCTLKDMLNKQKGIIKASKGILHNALLTLKILNFNEKSTVVAKRHWIIEKNCLIESTYIFLKMC